MWNSEGILLSQRNPGMTMIAWYLMQPCLPLKEGGQLLGRSDSNWKVCWPIGKRMLDATNRYSSMNVCLPEMDDLPWLNLILARPLIWIISAVAKKAIKYWQHNWHILTFDVFFPIQRYIYTSVHGISGEIGFVRIIHEFHWAMHLYLRELILS